MPLHPDYEAMLAAMEDMGGPKITEMSVPDAREMFRMMQPPVDVPVGDVENRSIDGPGGQIPLRIYAPPAESDAPPPIAMMFHGGGWVIGGPGYGGRPKPGAMRRRGLHRRFGRLPPGPRAPVSGGRGRLFCGDPLGERERRGARRRP